MMDGDDDTTIGTGGWVLVGVSGLVTFAVLRGWFHYLLVPSLLFALAIALIVLLVLYRLAEAVNRYDDAEEASRVRKVVPASDVGIRTGEGAAIPAAMAVPVRSDAAVVPQRPSSVVRPLAEVEAPPVILPVSLVVEAEAEVAALAAKPAASGKPKTKAKADAKPKAASKAGATAKTKAEAKPKAEPKAKAAKAPKTKPAGLVRLQAARGGKADDLQEIEGIGPALEKLLNSLGFYHFDQLAAWTEADVALIDAEMKTFKGRITRDKWVEQAKIIVSNGLEAFRERARANDY